MTTGHDEHRDADDSRRAGGVGGEGVSRAGEVRDGRVGGEEASRTGGARGGADEGRLHDDAGDEPFPEERRRRGCGSRLLVVALVVVLVGLVAAGGAYAYWHSKVDPSGGQGAAVKVTVPLGASTQSIGKLLAAHGVVTDARIFRIYTRIHGDGPFQAGEYTFRVNSSMGQAVSVLDKGPDLKFERLTIPEGFTLKQVAERVGKLQGRSADAFLQAATSAQVHSKLQPSNVTSLEGLTFPDTYNLEPKDDERTILTRLVSVMDDTTTALGFDDAPARVGITPYQAVIVASLIERETKFDDERPKVARVIYNRLKQGMPLQIDATIVYALGRSGENTTVLNKDLEIDSPYNTYKIKGLPPTPIAAPGRASLEAALNPADGPWLYYVVTETDGHHSFAATAAEHQANIRKAIQNGVRSG